MLNFDDNIKVKKKRSIFIWITTIALTIAITGFSILAYFIYSAFTTIDDKFILGPSLTANSNSSIARVDDIDNNNNSFLIEYPLKSTTDSNTHYFLNQNELNEFQDFLFRNLWYGPEIFELKHIIINDWRYFEKNVHGEYLSDGFYVSDSNEIYINIEGAGIKDISFSNYVDGTLEYENIKKYKFDYLLTIIGHEYGHHLTHSYFQSVRTDEGTTNTYSENGKLFPWNKKYYEQFILLNNFRNSEKILPNDKTPNSEKSPIASILSLSDIYTWAVETKHENDSFFANKVENENKLYLFWNYDDVTLPVSERTLLYSYKNTKSHNFSELQYIYSLSEQSTRQIELLMLHMDWSLYGISSPKGIPLDLTYYQNTRTLHTFWVDFLRVYGINIYKLGKRDSFVSNNLNFPNSLFGGIFNKKNITNISRDYFKFLLTGMGFNKEISKIWVQNNIYIKNNNASINGNINSKLIRFAGYVDKDYKSIIIDKDVNNEIEIKKSTPLNSNNLGNGIFNFNAKTDLLADRNDRSSYIYPWNMTGFETSLNKSAYVLKDFIDGDTIMNHKLYFWKGDLNGNHVVDDDEVNLIDDINVYGKDNGYISSFPHGSALQKKAYNDGDFSTKFYSAKLGDNGNLIWEFK